MAWPPLVCATLPSKVPNAARRTSSSTPADDARVGKESLDVHWGPYAAHGAATALSHQVRSLDMHDTLAVADRMSDLNRPAAVMWGAADPFQTIELRPPLSAAHRWCPRVGTGGGDWPSTCGLTSTPSTWGCTSFLRTTPDVVAKAITDVVGRT